eukprot:GFKZ01003567.1.p1 GENE.GFKZ01003567.1~~GFKZ01003567.1.p1  ORF type:complete len:496 (-),score=50.33 GFKZ01003567.1:484-1971(-)
MSTRIGMKYRHFWSKQNDPPHSERPPKHTTASQNKTPPMLQTPKKYAPTRERKTTANLQTPQPAHISRLAERHNPSITLFPPTAHPPDTSAPPRVSPHPSAIHPQKPLPAACKMSTQHSGRLTRLWRRMRRLRWPSVKRLSVALPTPLLILLVLYAEPMCETRRAAGHAVRAFAPSHKAPPARLQVTVLTHSRAESLGRLLRSLERAEYDGDRVDLHIWVDRSRGRGWGWGWGREDVVDEGVVSVGRDFEWGHGEKMVHVWERQVGIWGQWVDGYRGDGGGMGGLILEDDLEVSRFYYRWLKEAKRRYGDRADVFGYTLQRGTLRANATGFGRRGIKVAEGEGAFLYLLLGSWGYMPQDEVWREFRHWFHRQSCVRGFRPYVEGLLPTKWYKKQEKQRSMWTMWHIYYAEMRGLYTVYANLKGGKTLAANWREPGLHFKGGGEGRKGRASAVTKEKDFELWDGDGNNTGFEFPPDPVKLAWNGTYVDRDGVRTKM